jgi:hypothetical protein
MLASIAIGAVPLLAVVAAVLWLDIRSAVLMRDPVAVFEGPWYTGALSQLGILVWAAAAAYCVLAASLLMGRARWFFIASAALTLLLGLDDAFVLHERVFPDYLGLDEIFVYGIYLGLTITYLLVFIRQILFTEYPLLAMAFGFFGLSIIMDVANLHGPGSFLLEDGAKFMGIVSMAIYYFRTAAHGLVQGIGERAPR